MDPVKIAVIGLGYVGLPLAQILATRYPVIGFDSDPGRIAELEKGMDRTRSLTREEILRVLVAEPPATAGLYCTTEEAVLRKCDYLIIAVPTPVDDSNNPDLTCLFEASALAGRNIKEGSTVIYESTVYPGATEEECVPILEEYSGLRFNKEFYVGYSPERVNPGDREHTIEKIVKVTSGSTLEVGKKVDAIYASVIAAGTYLAPSIKVAEAAKVIENTQRDINIACVNELAKIFNAMGLDTHEILKAAGTKWNFLPFTPGLVGGHCIGVDPYYLAKKAQEFGYHPEIILAGRRLNDSMGHYVASEVVKLMVKNELPVNNSRILVLGITFKENCPDVRNTRVVDLIYALQSYGAEVTIYDPRASRREIEEGYKLTSSEEIPEGPYDAIILAVAHDEFLAFDWRSLLSEKGILYDVKGFLPGVVDGRL
ncbi:UDP-N-acetyl-D-galactosamine dehydrogenase [Muriicola jejuensis]|uniref:Nucleotide sugar dehydrogenase n=1 Tax=Muriicola jejuensis TaxID=504488 RepID=A0A6P0UGE8_9FLAO|nr:nucleotide sugar dehydrogenase [Muriicola jejuensis]NER11520.1 nucleotide sugar dehydrogenase [Muriicola jejuensis]SMP20148.1 UDP-N-acetyl-D-galactosamine dehydrogenase [Muriicola jejuensis]